MSKFGENLKWFVVGAAESVKGSAKKAVDDVKDIKLPEVKLPDVKEVFKKKEEEVFLDSTQAISTKNALMVIYYLMAADGEVFHSEEEKFDVLGKDLDPDFDKNKVQIIEDCRKYIEVEKADYFDTLLDGVEKALASSVRSVDSFITPKLLVWDLLTVAYSDENYDVREKDLIRNVVRRLGIDKAVFEELESSIRTLIDLEKEKQWIKTTDRPYLTIEAMVNEIEDRKQVIFESVKELIQL